MPKIIYKKANEPENSVLITQGEKSEFVTDTIEQSDSISLELGTLITTGSDNSMKVKESNTIQSTTNDE